MADWRVNGNVIEIEDEDSGTWVYFCALFGVKTVEVDLLTGLHRVTLFVDLGQDGVHSLSIPRKEFGKRTVLAHLYDLGLSIMDNDDGIAFVQDVLLTSEQTAPRVTLHDKLGFVTLGGQTLYLLDTPIAPTGQVPPSSSYATKGLVTPKALLEDWLTLVDEEVLGRPAMETALAIGAVAPVAHLLRNTGTITDLPVIAYVGRSTTGKSTAMRVGASIWGLPIESLGIIEDLNSTENGFFASLAANTGFPAFVDETSAQPDWNFTRLLYFLPKGQSKKRCDKSGKLKKGKTFSSAVIFTGEQSILTQSSGNPGLHARIIELSPNQWTDDASHAERLTSGLCGAYGTAGPVVIQWLLDHHNDLPDIYQQEREALTNLLADASSIESRQLKVCATIMVAAQVLTKSLKIPLDINSISSFLIAQLKEKRCALAADRATSVYQSLLEEVMANGSKFVYPSGRKHDHSANRDVWGAFTYYKSTPCFWILQNRFEAMLRKAGIQSPRDITWDLANKGFLVRFSDRHYYRKHKINNINALAYCLLLPDTADLFDRLKELPEDASSRELMTALRGDSFDAMVFSTQAESDRQLKAAFEADTGDYAVGFAYPCAQSEALIINNPLAQALHVTTEVFVTFSPDERLAVLSSHPLCDISVKITLRPWNGTKISSSSRTARTLMDHMNVNLPVGLGIALTDITVEQGSASPHAVVSTDFEQANGIVVGPTATWALPPSVNYTSKRSELLIPDDDD